MTLLCFSDTTAVNPGSHDGGSPIPPNVDPTAYNLKKIVEFKKCSSHRLEIKHNYVKNLMKFYKSLSKPPPDYSQLFSVIGDHTLFFQPFDHRVLTYSLTAVRNIYY